MRKIIIIAIVIDLLIAIGSYFQYGLKEAIVIFLFAGCLGIPAGIFASTCLYGDLDD